MQKKITKAVILAGGLANRMLPVSKAVPKEMLPIVDKPAMQYNIEEAAASGITDILIITGRGKGAIEDYFDYSPEYEYILKSKGDNERLDAIKKIPGAANIYYVRQKEPKGLGHAVLCARSFVGEDDFLVMYGDDIIIGEPPAAKQLIDVYEKYGGICAAAVKEVEPEKLKSYCSLLVEPSKNCVDNSEFYVYDMNEKPKTEAEIFSNYAILGRALLSPEIFDILENQKPGANNEIQLTDSMKTLVRSANGKAPAKMIAKVFSGERHDMGSKLGFLIANVTEGVKHPETGEEFKKFLKKYLSDL